MKRNHNNFLRVAFNIAKINLGKTKLNPSVGCIVVKNNSVISSGITSVNGRPHAEFNALNKKKYTVKKLSTENKELYGSVKPTEIGKLILQSDNLDIKPSMIQPVMDIKTIGEFKVKISLHSEVDAEITIIVEPADSIQ